MSTLQAVELGVLGPLQVRQDGAPVTIPGAKPRAILTMLGLHAGAVVSAETLIDLLWGDDPPRTAAKALQTHISSLRRALGDGFVLTQGLGWILSTTEVDAPRYKLAAKAGRDATAAGDASQAVVHFEEALTLWRGTPELPDTRRGTSEKTRWVEGHAAQVEDRADALLAAGRAAEIIGELEAAVADAPLRERRWGQLMLALYRAGRQGEALGAYQRARSLLAGELGVDPGPELRRLETAIVAQNAALDYPVTQQLPSVMRAVTFLLTDIEGSTAAWEADADAMAVALARHDELVEQVVTSRGGRLIKTRGEGDATFSVFERPSAAAAAAIELQDAMSHEPWALHEPMRIRVALHTGEVELRDGDYFGRAVNRAARLRSLAVGGQILCSGATAELVIDTLPDDVVLADLGMRQLRNLPRPEHVFELRLDTAERPEETGGEPFERPGLPAVLTGPGPFVGRGYELEQLAFAWQTTLAGGTHAVLIAGEPGVGKTRLAGEWSRQAYAQGAVVLYGRSDEDLGAPYQPFAEALRSLVPSIGAGRLRGLRGVEALLPLVPGLTDLLPDLSAPTRADPDTERYALFDAVVALLELASASAPVIVVLDDLHWAAKPTLLLLRHLLRFGDHSRVQIVGTYRSTDLDRAHPLAAMLADLHRDGTANRLALSGLDEQEVTAYVAEAGYDDDDLARALASLTGGNPFFLIEALRHVDESGGVWDSSTLPQGVREAVSRRLSRLPADTNKALAAAAVIGSRFALDLVERVVDQDLVDAFDEACQAGIVIEEPGGRYRFNHAIVRQSLLAELASVRRMRLHQRIATILETEPAADDERLAELAYHYFECAWAGNAAKAVEYCRRAADQSMARLAYEGAADLYDHALHALEEIDDELPDRDDQVAQLLIARCEALLAAGDVASAAGAVVQLQSATADSARLAAWAACFDGQLSMLSHPERLDEVETAVAAAAGKLAQIADAAGEAKAHTVRAGCLARLGRIGDCESALDDALSAARRAGEHRRVNAVLANAPLAALWGPNPVPRAGGRCLDVVRLLRITTDSPAVEATSTRCQAVLEAFRGRADAARRMIDSARRTVTELGLRHALLEVEQFAGIVELVADDPGAAERHLRKAYHGFRRMGLDADTAETAAMLGRACLALDRDAEADDLCTESERLAGHALKASIAWRTLRALLFAQRGDHVQARQLAEAAVGLAERTDALVDHGDACLSLATVLGAAGDVAGARAAAKRSFDLYERKGAAALADMARLVLGERTAPPPAAPPEAPAVAFDTAAVRTGQRVADAINREDWDEFERLFAPQYSLESRRRIVGFTQTDPPPGGWAHAHRRNLEMGAVRVDHVVIAVRGERLALVRVMMGTADASPGAPQDEFLQVTGIDEDGRISLHIWFDVDDIDAAIAELDAAHARFEKRHPREALENAATRAYEHLATPAAAPPEPPAVAFDNAAVRVSDRLTAAVDRGDWDAFEELFAPQGSVESRRKVVGFKPTEFSAAAVMHQTRQDLEAGAMRASRVVIAVRGERLALARVAVGTADTTPGAPQDELLQLYDIDDQGRIALQIWFDVDDIDAAIAELDAMYARFEAKHASGPRTWNKAALVIERFYQRFAARDWDAIAQAAADNYVLEDRRRMVNIGIRRGRDAGMKELQATADVGFGMILLGIVATRGERLVLTRVRASGPDPGAVQNDALNVIEIDSDGRVTAAVVFDVDDFDAALKELDARYLAGEAAAYAHTWSAFTRACAALNRHESPATTPDWVNTDHRRGPAFAPGDMNTYSRPVWDLTPDLSNYVEVVHRLNDLGAIVTHRAHGTSEEGFDAEWRVIDVLTLEGDLINRLELFDEEDLDAAIARFDQLSRPWLRTAAARVYERILAYFAARDWAAITEVLAEDVSTEDRRRVVNAGLRHGREAAITEIAAIAEAGVTDLTSEVLATRGERLVLSRGRTSEGDHQPDAFRTDLLDIVEVDDNERVVARVMFDPADTDAAIAELDARYVAGEAAAHAHTWTVVTGIYAGVNRHELPATTPDWANVDHRHVITIAPGDLLPNLRAMWDIAPQARIYIEAVHRLNDRGTVVTHSLRGTSQEGFFAESRMVNLMTFEGDLVDRSELFDEAGLDSALAMFDRLSPSAPRHENAASRADKRFQTYFASGDWDAMARMLSPGTSIEDRRRVVNMGNLQGRDAELGVHAYATVGSQNVTAMVTATRGQRLTLSHYRFSGLDQRPDAFRIEMLGVVEIDTDERMAAVVVFDLDDIDAAIAELDARYLAGEAATYAHTWSVITEGYAAFNRNDFPAPDWVNIDHRRARAFEPGELTEYMHATWDVAPNVKVLVETVHRLSDLGAVVTHLVRGTSRAGFDAEWREVVLLTIEGDLFTRCEVFDDTDVDAAITRFEELHPQPRRSENAAARVYESVMAHFAARDWAAITESLAEDVSTEDRRRVVNAGLRHGPDAVTAEIAAVAEAGVTDLTSDVIATRGQCLVLSRGRASVSDQRPDAFRADLLDVVEIDTDERVSARVIFDLDDIDAALQELDARYLAGEAAAHAHTWSIVAGSYAALDRRELPAMTPDCVTIDHRRAVAFAPGELIPYVRTGVDFDGIRTYIKAVHRLSDLGAVSAYAAYGVSREGFDAEWRGVAITTVDGDRVNRCEMFDEADLDAALAKFEELSRPTPRPETTASRIADRVMAHFTAREWDAATQMLADDFSSDDRRRTVNAGLRHGRDAAIKDAHANAELGAEEVASTVIATRGDRLVLRRGRYSGGPEAFYVDALSIYEINREGRVAAIVIFDPADSGAAIAELDARYLAGEAAAHAHTWSVIAGVYAGFGQRQRAATTPEFAYVDHRSVVSIGPDELAAFIEAVWDQMPEITIYAEAVHRLSELGAVITHTAFGVSSEHVDAEWRMIAIYTVEHGLVGRCEMFDEADLDTALARFDELGRSTPRLENTASEVYARTNAYFSAGEWIAMSTVLAPNMTNDDRRHTVNSGVRRGRDIEIANGQAFVGLGGEKLTSTVVATRGGRLALCRSSIFGRDQQPGAFRTEFLSVVEIDGDTRLAAHVAFDLDDLDAAFEELETRYLAGDAATHAHTWSVISGVYSGFNRHEFTAATPSSFIDHRPLIAVEAVDLTSFVRALWDVTPDTSAHIEAVHRLSGLGAVVSAVMKGTSQEGFVGEWRMINVFTAEGELMNRCEIFDEADLDAALARFEELHPQPRRLENAASQMYERFKVCFAARDWPAITDMLADDVSTEDRRRVVNAGLRHGPDAVIAEVSGLIEFINTITSDVIATRGTRLALSRTRTQGYEAFHTDLLNVIEIDDDKRLTAHVAFEPDDLEAAVAELDARYVAGEAAAHAHTWSVITGMYATFNRYEMPAGDWVNVDHRRGTPFTSSDLAAAIRSFWDLTPKFRVQIETVHRLSDFGAVITHYSHGTSLEDTDVEWRMIQVLSVEGDRITRCELFDEADLDDALARFAELHPQQKPPENTASRVHDRSFVYFRDRAWIQSAEILTEDSFVDDRRRVTSSGFWNGRDVVVANLRALADAAPVAWETIATRGERLAVTRIISPNRDPQHGEFSSDMLIIAEIDTSERIAAQIAFEIDDIDAAFEELDTRYLAGEAAAYAQTWSVIAGAHAAANRRELPARTPDSAYVDHRPLVAIEGVDAAAALRAVWDVTSKWSVYIEMVHRLDELGAVSTQVTKGTSHEGLDVEVRMIVISIVEGDFYHRVEVFGEADVEAALVRFEELHTRRLENAASRVFERFSARYVARDWDVVTMMLADDVFNDDRRRVVNAGARRGRDATLASMRATADLGLSALTSTVLATRGERLALSRDSFSIRGEVVAEVLGIVEIDADERIVARLALEPDDVDAALAELDARYLAGEAAAYAPAWSVIKDICASFNRYELPAVDWVNVDDRRGTPFTSSDLAAALRSFWDLTPQFRIQIETVHRLSGLGAVITHYSHGTSLEGTAVEWRMIQVLVVEGDRVTRCELFDESDVDAALARFDELSRSAPALENAATRNWTCLADAFNRRDEDALLVVARTDCQWNDRRKGLRHLHEGPERQKVVAATFATVPGSWRLEVEHIAVRGARISLTRGLYRDIADPDRPITVEMLHVTEVDDDGLIRRADSFDPDDIDAALAELDARYLAGEAAAYAQTWSVITGAYGGFNRRDLAATTPDWVSIDRRRGAAFASGDMIPYIEAAWDDSPDTRIFIAAVHRLSDAGAVVTHVAQGISQGGFDAEWRDINMLTVGGTLVSRCELFDQDNLDAALARFDELTAPD